MLNEKVAKLLNEQINAEMYSAYLYLSMSNYLSDAGHPGFANWYFVQYREETEHALYLYKYMKNEGAAVDMNAIDAPDVDFAGVADVLDRTLAHECKVTGMINAIASACMEASDFRTLNFMAWFIKEQSEEEANCKDNLDKYKLAGESGIYQLDQEFGARAYAPSANPPVAL